MTSCLPMCLRSAAFLTRINGRVLTRQGILKQVRCISSSSSTSASPGKPTIVFVLGGPGTGKGTQCELVAKRIKHNPWKHISAGVLLRDEMQRPNSTVAPLIQKFIDQGAIVPSEITVGLLKRAVFEESGGMTQFLIDGFPRNLENNSSFLTSFGSRVEVRRVLFLDCDENTMIERILGRSRTSQRSDDNIETVRKRLVTFKKETLPVVEFWEKLGKVSKIDGGKSPEEVLATLQPVLESCSDSVKSL